MEKIKLVFVLLFFCILSYYAFSQLAQPLTGIDDANIFFVYARNLANGHGIVFFPGSNHVEGITSLLWLLIITPFFLISNGPEAYIAVVNLLLLCSGFYFFLDSLDAMLGRQKSSLTIYSGIALLWTLASPTYIIWTTLSLMDIGLWSTVSLFGAGLLLRAYKNTQAELTLRLKWATYAFLVVAIITRPEGAIVSAIYVILLTIRGWSLKQNLKQAVQKNRFLILFWIFCIAALTIFRQIYFGFPLPNTYYAKVSPSVSYNLSQGWTYFIRFITSAGLLPMVLGLMVFLILRGTAKFIQNQGISENAEGTLKLLPVLLITVVYLILPILSGGDHFYYFRFYQPAWPFLSLPVIGLVSISERYSIQKRLFSVWIPVAIAMSLSLLGVSPNWFEFQKAHRISWEYQVTQLGRSWGEALNIVLAEQPEYPRVGEVAVGGLSYAYKGEVIDLMGLNNLEMAHSHGDRKGVKNHAAFNKEVFYRQKPDLLLPRIYKDAAFPADFSNCGESTLQEALKRLLCEARFGDSYRLARISLSDDGLPMYLFFFVRLDYLPRMRGIDYAIISESH